MATSTWLFMHLARSRKGFSLFSNTSLGSVSWTIAIGGISSPHEFSFGLVDQIEGQPKPSDLARLPAVLLARQLAGGNLFLDLFHSGLDPLAGGLVESFVESGHSKIRRLVRGRQPREEPQTRRPLFASGPSQTLPRIPSPVLRDYISAADHSGLPDARVSISCRPDLVRPAARQSDSGSAWPNSFWRELLACASGPAGLFYWPLSSFGIQESASIRKRLLLPLSYCKDRRADKRRSFPAPS